MTKIKDALLDSNPWWKAEFSVDFKEREIYKQLEKFMDLPHILALTGLRRVGKTTLMMKMAVDYLSKDFEAKNIIYFSFDEFKEIEIRDVMKEYEALMEKNFGSEKYLLLLDEIQKLNNWEEQLKRVYDHFGKTVKVIISGSESLFIKKKSRESLAGRLFEFKLEPLSFREFLIFKSAQATPAGLYEAELARLFNEYMLSAGFPELVGVTEKSIVKKYIKEAIIEKVIYRDLAGLFKIKDASLLASLLAIIMEGPGQIMELSELSKEIGVSRQTISQYLWYLEASFLINKLYNFSPSQRKVERKLKKYYPAIISAELLFKDDEYSKSRVFEWLIITRLKAEFFWRDPYKNEVDIILPGKKLLPIEVKYGKIELSGIKKFMEKYKISEGVILSKDHEELLHLNGKTISVIPAFKFLLEPKI